VVRLSSAEEMTALGVTLGAAATAGGVLGLTGDLGAGKTVPVQGLAAGLGVPPQVAVTSPTFTLIHRYEGGRIVLYHADLYRLERRAELEQIGLAEIYEEEAVVAVEWFDRFPDAVPRDHLAIRITVTSELGRLVELEANGPRSTRWLAGLPA